MTENKTALEKIIGNTPLVELTSIATENHLSGHLFAKVEGLNPAGSIKDRVAAAMIEDAQKKGLIREGTIIIEPTSGNTGIGLAAICAAHGYSLVITMPETMSPERVQLMRAYGATVILTDGKKGMTGAIERAEIIAKENPNSFIAGQFTNPANPTAHYQTTGPEIWEQMGGEIDAFVACVGTGGTITGVGRYLREKNPAIRIIAVEPMGSPVLSGGTAGAHAIQGIGAGFIPEVLDTTIYDEVITVSDADAFQMGRMVGEKEGILVGISAGAAVWAACEVARDATMRGQRIVTILPDGGEKYLSTAMYA